MNPKEQIDLLIQLRDTTLFKPFQALAATVIEQARMSLETAQTEREIALAQGQIQGIRNLFGYMEKLEMMRDAMESDLGADGGEVAPNPGIRYANPEE